jgi:chromosome segregation protein
MQINGLQIELEHLEVDIGKSVSEIKEEPVTGSSDLERFNLSGEEERLRKLRERVDRFGPVNLLAPEEYNKLEERFNFLNVQIEDLTSAISSLKKAMHKIDRESSKRFIETIEVVNKKFQETFTRLFRGGEAKLVLVDPEDILNTGVDIMVRPKGKGFQSINLLSGGEKALSAIALVISASFVRPAPFFLFDEIDAPLDDVNTTQFVDLITEISKESQILIITHNKKTMQAVNSLIGITSDKPGISKVVSVELQTI